VTQPARGDAAFREAFAHAAIGMSLVTLDGRYVQVNESFCRMIGYTEAELLATDFQHITHPEDLENDLDHVRRLLTGEVTHYHMEKRYVRKNGSVLPILLSVAVVRETDGTPMHFVAQMQDLTSRHQLEAERLAAERRVAELERQASMNLIAGSIAHDFNNLLASVIGFTALARDHVAPASPLGRYLDEIESASQEAARLSQQMLAYSGSAKYEQREVDVAATVRRAAQRVLAQFPDTRLESDSALELPSVVGDEVQLQQALVNVLANACEAVHDSNGTVRIGAKALPDRRAVQIYRPLGRARHRASASRHDRCCQ
jgi:PAS domain S-box-containing protein